MPHTIKEIQSFISGNGKITEVFIDYHKRKVFKISFTFSFVVYYFKFKAKLIINPIMGDYYHEACVYR